MAEALVKFERENAEGLIAVGSYLGDAAKRLGVKFEADCITQPSEHFCPVEVIEGADLLSEKTTAEKEILKEAKLGKNWRLACHAKIEKAGDVVVMTKKKAKVEEEAEKDQAEDYRKRFEDLPLEKKMSELVRLESMALSETLSFVVNSPYKVADKIMDVLAEFGFKLEKEKKDAAKPEEHRTNGSNEKSETDAKAEAERGEEYKDEKGD